MNPTIDSLIIPSVSLWLDNLLIEKNGGFSNTTGILKKVPSPIEGFSVWASPDRQWVYDSSITGAQIPTGVTKNSVLTPRSSTLKLDFLQGAVYMPTNTTGTVSAIYSKKEINIYISEESLDTILFEKKYSDYPTTTSFDPSNITDFVYPCIILKTSTADNETLDFAGNVSTKFYVRLILLTNSTYLYQTACGVIRDQKETHIPIFNSSELPFNEYGDLKTGSFDYSNQRSIIQQDAGRLAYLKDVSISPFPYALIKEMGIITFASFIDLDLEILRYPR